MIGALAILLGCATPIKAAESGQALFEQHCLHCHNGSVPRAPSVETLRQLPAVDIMRVLKDGTMRFIGLEFLRDPDDIAIAEYLSGEKFEPASSIRIDNPCKATPLPIAQRWNEPSWNGWSPDFSNRRFQPAEAAQLTPTQVPKLKLRWAFAFPGQTMADAQPTVVAGRVYAGSRGGGVYALDAASGCTIWAFTAHAGVRGAIKVAPVTMQGATRYLAFFGDVAGHVYALDAETGALVWERIADPHPVTKLTGSMQFFENRLYIPVTSSEQASSGRPGYPCCNFRGSLLAVDAATGKDIWRHYSIADEPKATKKNADGVQMYGPSGGGLWSAPTIDAKRRRIYITTGDAVSNPPADTTDSIVALDLQSGAEIWHYRGHTAGAWNLACSMPDTSSCPDNPGPDQDMTGSPILVTAGERDLVIAGQKTGMLHAVDAETGKLVWKYKIGEGGGGGGIEWGPAVSGGKVYAALSDIRFQQHDGFAFDLRPSPLEGGGLWAFNVADGSVAWHSPAVPCGDRPKCSPAQSAAVSVIPGVVFSGSVSGVLRAYDSETGRIIHEIDTAQTYNTVNGVKGRGGAIDVAGPVIAGGRLYMTSGYGLMGGNPGNVLLVYSVDGR